MTFYLTKVNLNALKDFLQILNGVILFIKLFLHLKSDTRFKLTMAEKNADES